MWRFKLDECVNFLLQSLQLKGRSPVWISMWRFKSHDFVNFWSQSLQLKGRSHVWMSIWSFKWDDFVNVLLQSLQPIGRSPVWISMWRFTWDDFVNVLLQSLQLKGRSPVWISVWRFKSHDFVNFLSQSLQLKGRSPVWMSMWVFKLLERVNVLVQTSQVCLPLSTCIWSSQGVSDCLQSSSVSSWLLVSTLTHSLENTDCSVLWDVCSSPLLLSEKLCVRSSFVFSSTVEWQSNRSVQHSITTTIRNSNTWKYTSRCDTMNFKCSASLTGSHLSLPWTRHTSRP